MLYLYLSGGYDKARISIGTWINFFSLFYHDDDKIMQQKLSFKLLDIDRDGQLNILNLLHLHKNLPTNSIIG
jgi:Ca2+-binding EF-hand superfamily protein